MVDLLTDVLQAVRVDAAKCGWLEGSDCWETEVEDRESATLYAVTVGGCVLEVTGSSQVDLKCGDLVLVPHGNAHRLKRGTGALAIPLREAWSPATDGSLAALRGTNTPLRLACVELSFEDRRHNPMLSALPAVVRLPRDPEVPLRWLEPVLQFMMCEATADLLGASSVLCRLGEVLFIQMVRAHLQRLESVPRDAADCPGWLAAISEPQIGSALGLIHESPAEAWTVAGLAARVGMSRSAFAARFAQLVGEPPLHYVTRWRMQKAAAMLRGSTSTLSDIASRIGYESEAAFSKAFKRWSGIAPGAYRRAARTQGIASAA